MQYRGKGYKQRMTDQERNRGWVFFALFVLVFPFLMGLLQRSVEGRLPVAEANVVYYLLLAFLVVLLFWSYLQNNFSLLVDRLPQNLLALLTGLVGSLLLQWLVMLIPYPVENPNLYSYPEQYILSPSATLAILLVLIPLVEGVLFRGLLFGTLRQFSRQLAWAVSATGYCLYCVWQFAFVSDSADARYLMLAFQYLPTALGLTWCYDRGGSIWASIVLHGLMNGLFMFLLVR